MAITSGFFDSVNGDRTYDADQMSTYFEGLISDGVYENVGDRFLVTAGSGLALNVGSGRAIIRSHWIKNDSDATVTLDPADIQYPRIDAVCLRLDFSERSISLTVKKGTPAISPSMPQITRDDTVWELYLAIVLVRNGATAPATIEDMRPSTYCGWVTGIIQQVDTSQLFLQWQNAYADQYARFDAYMNLKMQQFNSWFETLTSQLVVDTSLKKYQNKVYAGGGSNAIDIGIPEYDKTTDILLVYINGLFVAEDIDYEQIVLRYENTDAIKLLNGRTFNNGDVVYFLVLKNLIGGNVRGGLMGIAYDLANGYESALITGNATEMEG